MLYRQPCRAVCLIAIHLVLVNIVAGQKRLGDTLTLAKVLSSLYDVSQLPLYMDKTYSAQVSSYDTTGGNDDGFSGKYSFLRRNTDSSLVIFDVKGPGLINRIWTPTPTEDTLDFYFDGKAKPGLSVKYSDLFSGNAAPFAAPLCGNDLGGFYCYFPILFNKGCVIISRGKKIQFQQIGYRSYPAGTVLQSFSTSLRENEKQTLQSIAQLWNKTNRSIEDMRVSGSQLLQTASRQTDLQPGTEQVIFEANTGGRIAGITISPAAAFEGLLKQVDIIINWDDDAVPAVDCPLADFFGYAFGKPAMQSLLLGNNVDTNYCYIPMPFDKKAVIRLRYRKVEGLAVNDALHIQSTVYYRKEPRNPIREGKLYTSWNRVAADGQPHTFLNTNGRGHYIGTVLQSQGLRPGMTYFFEGDDSTVIDGSMRMHGTGSEDYFNGGWYALSDKWDGKLSLPLHGCLDYSLPNSRTGAYRFYLSDKMSFEKSIFQSIEHGPAGNHAVVDYTSLGFYYCDRAPAPAEITQPVNALTKVYVPDTLIMYPQLMKVGVDNNISVATAWAYYTGGLSYTYTVTDESGLKIAIDEIPLGEYKLLADFVRNPAGASFSVWQGQHNISGWLSASAGSEQVEKNMFIAQMERTASRSSITVHFQTMPGKDKWILNRLLFIRQRVRG